MYIIISGNVVDGTTPWGPFEDAETAGAWANRNLRGVDWHVTELESPVKGIEAENAAKEARVKVDDAISCIVRQAVGARGALEVLVQALDEARAGVAG